MHYFSFLMYNIIVKILYVVYMPFIHMRIIITSKLSFIGKIVILLVRFVNNQLDNSVVEEMAKETD